MQNVNELIKNNVDKVKEFFVTHLTHYSMVTNNEYKINVDCIDENCDKGRHQLKAVINLDMGNVYCYKHGGSISIYQYCKHYNIHNEFVQLLSELNNSKLEDIKQILSAPKKEKSVVVKDDIVSAFIRDNGLISVKDNKYAYEYALQRTFNNKQLISNWYCDNQYIYAPTVYKHNITGYIGRLYLDTNAPRYNNKLLDREKLIVYNYDNVVEEYNPFVYLVEGMFDSIAVNHTYNRYISIGLCGKSHYKEIIKQLSEDIPIDTTICICLDSVSKDKDIAKTNIDIYKYCTQFFTSVVIIDLQNGDPNEIVSKFGTIGLKNQLENNRYSLFKYKLKYGS